METSTSLLLFYLMKYKHGKGRISWDQESFNSAPDSHLKITVWEFGNMLPRVEQASNWNNQCLKITLIFNTNNKMYVELGYKSGWVNICPFSFRIFKSNVVSFLSFLKIPLQQI